MVVDTDAGKPSPAHRPHRVLVLVAALAGALTGGLLVAWLLQPPPAPSPIAVTLDTFPEEFMGAARNDLALRRAGFGPTVDRLNKEFEEQLEAFRFAHGGRGATFGYGRLVNLTIVDGMLAPGVPREGQMDFGGRVSETRRFISLDSSTVSCTFEPQPVPNASLGMEDFGDLSGVGRSECVLVDRGRNLSLRVAHSPLVRGSSAADAASSFSEALKGLHAQLVD
ncbi:MAG: hypothetical protein ACTHWA_02970 [Arachnia sp.]